MPHPLASVTPHTLGLALVLAMINPPEAFAAQPLSPDTDARQAIIADRMLQALVDTSGVPGLGAAVWRDGRIVWTGSAGVRDLERGLPVERDTVFRLASVSKLLTVTAAAALRERDALDVDVPVSSVLDDTPGTWSKITPRHLAAHLSGLPHYQDIDADRGGRRYPDIDAAVDIFRARPLLSTPGERYTYSSWGYTLLSAVVEQAAHKPFLDYIRDDIATGLTLMPDATDSGNPAASHAYEFVEGENGRIRRAAPHDYSYTWAGGGLGATPSAVATFGGRLLQGRPVSRDTFEWMLRPTRDAEGREVGEEEYAVGFGWRSGRDRDGDRIAHHAGVTVGARSALVVWPDGDAASSLLSNALWVASIEQSAMTLAAPFRPSPDGLLTRECPVQALRYEGRYGQDAISGAAHFRVEAGLCVGELIADTTLHAKFDRFPQKDADRLRIVGLDPHGGLGRAGLATPIGLYDLRATAEGGYTAAIGTKTTLSLRFL